MRRLSLLYYASSAIAALVPATLCAQGADTIAARELAPGVAYRQFTDAHGPWAMHLIRIDLRHADIELRHARAFGQFRGRERTTEMVRHVTGQGATILAAINGDFFSLSTGENENNQVIGGEWWKGLKITDSPYDTFDNPHVQFGIDAARRPMIGRFILDGTAWIHDVPMPILTVNFNPSGIPEGTTLYTARFGARTPRDTSRLTAEVSMVAAGRRGDTLLYVSRGAISGASGSAIPADGAVLAAYGAGSRTKEVQAIADGDTVRLLLATLPRSRNGAVPAMIIGGWPRILRDGVNIARDAATLEGTISRNAEVRHPRTAVGFSRDSSTLYLLTVDGRQERSAGMTLIELADVLARLGAWQAMNFDGGGSTTMVIGGLLVNQPSDATGERPVGNVLLVVRRP